MSPIRQTIEKLVGAGGGIVAADERLPMLRAGQSLVASTAEFRRDFHELLATSPQLAQWVAGVCLFEEGLRSFTKSGATLPELLLAHGLLPGVRADLGAIPAEFDVIDRVTDGISGLDGRLATFAAKGARFAKWTIALSIEERGLPSQLAIATNSRYAASFARSSQVAGLAPIISITPCYMGLPNPEKWAASLDLLLAATIAELERCSVLPEEILLQIGLPVGHARQLDPGVARDQVYALCRMLVSHLPPEFPGVLFHADTFDLAGLLALNEIVPDLPWRTGLTHGSVLQQSILDAWSGDAGHREAAQALAVDHIAQLSEIGWASGGLN